MSWLVTTVQRNYIRILFPITVILLFICLYYLYTIEHFPGGADLCVVAKDRLSVDKENHKNATKQWWEWACLLEIEFDKQHEYTCQDERLIGNYHICFDEAYKPTPPCLVYSFGIDNDFRFDDKMAELGCEVYSFDPSMNVDDHKRSERVNFFNIGLSTRDDDNFVPKMDGYTIHSTKRWRTRTLTSLKKMLGHEHRAIDILKMDVETYEWVIMPELLKNGSMKSVRQLTLEWHIFPNEPMRTEFHNMYGTYLDLKKVGFRQFYLSYWARYHNLQYFNSQNDNSLVNELFDAQAFHQTK